MRGRDKGLLSCRRASQATNALSDPLSQWLLPKGSTEARSPSSRWFRTLSPDVEACAGPRLGVEASRLLRGAAPRAGGLRRTHTCSPGAAAARSGGAWAGGGPPCLALCTGDLGVGFAGGMDGPTAEAVFGAPACGRRLGVNGLRLGEERARSPQGGSKADWLSNKAVGRGCGRGTSCSRGSGGPEGSRGVWGVLTPLHLCRCARGGRSGLLPEVPRMKAPHPQPRRPSAVTREPSSLAHPGDNAPGFPRW